MTNNQLSKRLEWARRVAQEAGAVAASYQRDPSRLTIDSKGPQDWVTVADKEVEALIKRRLGESFPDDTFIGEEAGGHASDAVWVVDPIDGTTNFLRGLPEYAVSMAFVADGRTELGVIYAPAFDHLYAARRGHGAYRGEERLSVRDTPALDTAVVTVGYGAQQDREAFLACLKAVLEHGAAFRRFGSATIGLTAVAAGHVDAFWQAHLAAWDVLAGLLLVEEAGGVTNDFLADDGLIRGNPTLATTPKLAAALSRITNIPMPA